MYLNFSKLNQWFFVVTCPNSESLGNWDTGTMLPLAFRPRNFVTLTVGGRV